MEVGPLARLLAGYTGRRNPLKSTVDGLLTTLGTPCPDLPSVMGRHAARAVECKLIADRCVGGWIKSVPGADL